MKTPHDCNTAYLAAVAQIKADSNVESVTIEFVMRTNGLTKWMKVYRDDRIEISAPLAD